MIRRMLCVLAVVLPSLGYEWAAAAQEQFRLLDDKGIRARVIGRDITNSSRWSIYLRSDGALLRDEMGRKWIGIWKIQNNRLCMSNPSVESPICNEVWMSGENIRLRAHKDEETWEAVVEKHKTN